MRHIAAALTAGAALLLAGCSDVYTGIPADPQPAPVVQQAAAEPEPTAGCDAAFRNADRVVQRGEDLQPHNLRPLITGCQTVADVVLAAERWPDVLGDVDTTDYVVNRCTYEPALRTAKVCRGLP